MKEKEEEEGRNELRGRYGQVHFTAEDKSIFTLYVSKTVNSFLLAEFFHSQHRYGETELVDLGILMGADVRGLRLKTNAPEDIAAAIENPGPFHVIHVDDPVPRNFKGVVIIHGPFDPRRDYNRVKWHRGRHGIASKTAMYKPWLHKEQGSMIHRIFKGTRIRWQIVWEQSTYSRLYSSIQAPPLCTDKEGVLWTHDLTIFHGGLKTAEEILEYAHLVFPPNPLPEGNLEYSNLPATEALLEAVRKRGPYQKPDYSQADAWIKMEEDIVRPPSRS